MFCVFHKLKPSIPTRPSLNDTMAQSKNDLQMFVASAFLPEKTIVPALDVVMNGK